jgi:hypothetical protein
MSRKVIVQLLVYIPPVRMSDLIHAYNYLKDNARSRCYTFQHKAASVRGTDQCWPPHLTALNPAQVPIQVQD